MKRYIYFVAAALMLASCSGDEPASGRLPDGKYPLDLTATVIAPAARSGGMDCWNGGEEIAVNIGDYAGKYTVHANGKATASDAPYYWQSTAKTTVSAWYPYAAGEQTYDIADQSQGYADFDVLYAETEGSYAAPVQLVFSHQMAKISYTLKGRGVSDAELDAATVTLFGDKSVRVNGGKITEAAASHSDEIKPCHDAESRTGSAVMTPQDMTGKPLIKVSFNGNTFYYSPTSEAEGLLQSGHSYSYAITLKADGIEVTEATGAQWTDGGSEDVKIVLAKYTASDVKKGDYIYKNGNISDGGLRKIYSDGTMESEAIKPQPSDDPDNPVVGIVFWTPSETDYSDPARLTPASLTDDKIMAADHPKCTRGLAVAVKAVTNIMPWQSEHKRVSNWQTGNDFTHERKSDFVSIGTGTNPDDNMNRIYGYQKTIVIRAFNNYCKNSPYDEDFAVVQPVAAVDEFSDSNPAPANSTGWFTPSPKEMDLLCNRDVDDIWSVVGADKTATRDLVNISIAAAGGDKLMTDKEYWTSSENITVNNLAVSFTFSDSRFQFSSKWTFNYYVRAVCAF